MLKSDYSEDLVLRIVKAFEESNKVEIEGL